MNNGVTTSRSTAGRWIWPCLWCSQRPGVRGAACACWLQPEKKI